MHFSFKQVATTYTMRLLCSYSMLRQGSLLELPQLSLSSVWERDQAKHKA